jgi:hypothetical protein
MDYSQIGFGEVWEDEARAHRRAEAAKWHAGIFTVLGSNLLISIIRTISTSPGTIPDHKEWDMNTATESLDDDVMHDNKLHKSQTFTNPTIEQHT